MANIPFRSTRLAVLVTLTVLLCSHPAAADDPVIPLPADVAKDLAKLGDGVVGKAIPAPTIDDVRAYLMLGPGTWEYEIVAGGDDGEKVRTESHKRLADADGNEVWERKLGSEYVEHLKIHPNGDFSKALEDDIDLGYTSRFQPSILWLAHAKPGTKRTIDAKIEAFKTSKPEHISYHGTVAAELAYVGAYEVTTPAGTFPAILVHADYKIEIGPASVDDSMYAFYAKGIGKVAEIEATRVSALLIYHSNTRVAKVLKSYPKQ
jgi:hypothetical protein